MKIYDRILRKKNPTKYWIKKGAKVGQNTEISFGASLGTEPYLIEIGSNCYVTGGVTFIPHDGSGFVVRNLDNKYKNIDIFKGKTIVGNNVFIGNSSTILPGLKIGNNVIIGCNSVVTHDIPDNCVCCGVPAKVVESINDFIKKNKIHFYDTHNLDSTKKKKYLLDRFGLK